MEVYSMEMPKSDIPTIGTNCQICDAFIPIVSGRVIPYTRICEECKKRLKELLYPKEE